ncbi:MAG: SHOCT domain-containing protein [Terriglobales bacterium]
MQGYWGATGWWWTWWVAWIVIIVWAFAWWVPTNRRIARATPLEVLQHRLARGEITPEEYERRRALLERDRKLPPAA